MQWKQGTAYARPRSFDALAFRLKGTATYRHQKQRYSIQAGDLLFIPAHCEYQFTSNKDVEIFVVHFKIEDSNFNELHTFTPTNPDVFHRLYEEMSKTWQTKPVGYRAILSSIFYKIVAEIEIQTNKKLLSIQPTKLQDALDYFRLNFADSRTSVETAAKHIGTSSSYLRRLFRSFLQETPLHYLSELRMNHAIGLLKTGYYTIEEIAFQSGFNDSKYFSSLYKERTGFLPSEKLHRARQRTATKK